MNHSLRTADRAIHVKIVVVALIAATVVVSISAHVTRVETAAGARSNGPVLRAGKPATYTHRDAPFIR
jgi:hypothetical protein